MKAQKTQEELPELPPNYRKEFQRGVLSQEGAVTIANYSDVWGVINREEPSKTHLIKVLSVSHCVWMAQQTFVYQTLTPFIFCELPYFLWSLRPPPLPWSE